MVLFFPQFPIYHTKIGAAAKFAVIWQKFAGTRKMRLILNKYLDTVSNSSKLIIVKIHFGAIYNDTEQ